MYNNTFFLVRVANKRLVVNMHYRDFREYSLDMFTDENLGN